MPRRGRVDGGPYEQRSDLRNRTQPIQVPTGGKYGTRQASEDAQRAQPLPGLAAPPGGFDQVLQAMRQEPPPPEGGILRPTEHPEEPVTAGLEGPPAYTPINPVDEELRGLYKAHPTEELRQLLEEIDLGG